MEWRGADWAEPQPNIASTVAAIRENFRMDIAGTWNLINRLKNTQLNPGSVAFSS
jgi:hypothetical protein